ncbi:MAG: nuclear transport factor 2 family protein [Acidobacteriaceae bacterium]
MIRTKLLLLLAFALCLSALHAQDAASTAAAPSPQVAEFQQIEDKWSDALETKNQYELELTISPTFVGISGSGVVTNHDQEVANMFVKGAPAQTLTQKVADARVLGDIAIDNGTYVLSTKAGKGVVEEKGVFTHVFQRGPNGWLCINAQRTIVVNQAIAKAKLETKKKKK